jgi:hypothetical protein
MIVEVNNIKFYLDPQDEVLGDIHAKMIEDFKDESKLEYFKQLLETDSNTAFSIFVNENKL